MKRNEYRYRARRNWRNGELTGDITITRQYFIEGVTTSLTATYHYPITNIYTITR